MPTPGFSAIGNCYLTQAEAVDAYYSSKPMQITSVMYNQNAFFFHRYQKYNGVWYEQSGFWSATSGMDSTYWGVAPLSYAGVGSCTIADPSGDSASSTDPVEAFADGHILGWGVALAMVAAWSIHVLRRAMV